MPITHQTVYSETQGATSWDGISLADGKMFDDFMVNEVAPRLHDDSGKADFASHLNSLASTGFAQDSLRIILEAEQPEERDWAVGEAMAEVWLSHTHGVVWPWNMERDKRTPKASLPGADLVGFITKGAETRLALGEVKCSSDSNTPPNVMYGRSGMTQQLEDLATDLGLLYTLIRWLQPRCRGNSAEQPFNAAIKLLLESGNKALTLFGVLVRDTQPHESDLRNRGLHLGGIVTAPSACQLLALYLPCPIASLPARVKGGVA
ncbi:MAG: hypothetical protein U9R55_03525 [Pseudomonadota bacterium]|nr:hypothetical protein [Pseudomonadota bacterium]